MNSEITDRVNRGRSQFFSDYGMLFVLLLLCVLFSLLTLKEQHPTGAAAGTQVAKAIVAANPTSEVLIVARPTSEDREFSAAVRTALENAGATVLDTVNGSPADVRGSIEQILEEGAEIDRDCRERCNREVDGLRSVRIRGAGQVRHSTPLHLARFFQNEQRVGGREPDCDLCDYRHRNDHGDYHRRH